MSGGKRQNTSGFVRKRVRQAERRRPHVDKYADQRMDERVADLVERFKSEERDHERR